MKIYTYKLNGKGKGQLHDNFRKGTGTVFNGPAA